MHASAALSGQQIHLLMFSYVFFSGVVLIAWLLFLNSLRQALGLVPTKQRVFPRWFLWVTVLLAASYVASWALINSPWVSLLCAFIGLLFTWLMLPFGVPMSLARIAGGDRAIVKRIRLLGRIGLVNQICLLIMLAIKTFLFFVPETANSMALAGLQQGSPWSLIWAVILVVVGATAVITWVFYWARVVSLRSELT